MKRLDCCVQGQGQSGDSKFHLFVWRISSERPDIL